MNHQNASKCISRVAQVQQHLIAHPSVQGRTRDKPIILYDLRSRVGAWSVSTQLPKYMENQPELRKLGIAPTAVSRRTGLEFYTLPAIRDQGTGRSVETDDYVSVVDSSVIAEYLDETYPEHPIFPADSKALQSVFVMWIKTNIYPLVGRLIVSSIPDILASEREKQYFRDAQKRIFGKDINDVCPKGEIRQKVWQQLGQQFDTLDEHLSRNRSGDFVMGETVSYADMVLVALFLWMKNSPSGGQRDGEEFKTVWDVMKSWHNGRWARLMDAMAQYMEQK
ncbi:hypothetical protein FRB97_009470 [Tulasnella sp. 331]|nr:hypothetical protein FRB97_009470 [Tulasnella sp. 331]